MLKQGIEFIVTMKWGARFQQIKDELHLLCHAESVSDLVDGTDIIRRGEVGNVF